MAASFHIFFKPNNFIQRNIIYAFMLIKERHEYYIYITTNPNRKVVYTGVTNNLCLRLIQHWQNRGDDKTFAGKYYCYCLIYYEQFQYIKDAIAREDEIKGWRRQKKNDLIKTMNPTWTFLNVSVCGQWPPADDWSK